MNNTIERTARKGMLLLSAGLFLFGGAACGKEQDYYNPETITATGGNTTGQPDLRDDPMLLDIITNSKGEGKYQADKQWQQVFTSGKASVNIDADVIVPDVDKYTVTKVSDLKLTQEDADKAFEYLSQGKELLGDSGQQGMTQAESMPPATDDGLTPPTGSEETMEPNDVELSVENIQQQIDQLTKVKTALEQGKTTVDGITYNESPEEIQSMIDELERSKAQAAQTDVQQEPGQPITKFSETETDETAQLLAYVDLGRPARDRILVQNYEENHFQHAQISFESADSTHSSILDDSLVAPGAAIDTQPQGVDMTKAEAEAKAREAAEALGLQLEVVSVRRGYGYMWEETQKEGWVVRMGRSVDGIPAALAASRAVMINVNPANAETYGLQELFSASTDSPDATPLQSVQVSGYDYEELLVCLDDSGIIYLDWKGGVQLGDVENDNVQLMPFEELKGAIAQSVGSMNLIQQTDLENNDAFDKLTINIDEVKLGLMRIPMEGDPKGGRLIPVWTLSGSYTPEYNKEKMIANLDGQVLEEGETAEDIWNGYFSPEAISKARQSYGIQLVINALDGNVIPAVL